MMHNLSAAQWREQPTTAETSAQRANTTIANTTIAKRRIEPLMSSEGVDYNAIFRAAHDFMQTYNAPIEPDEAAYWTAVEDEAGKLSKRFDGNLFARALLVAVIVELEREWKRVRSAETSPEAARANFDALRAKLV